jgi:hypothetical protein
MFLYLTRGQRPTDFVREVHVAGSVDQIEQKRARILGIGILEEHGRRLRLDGDAALFFDLEEIEHLVGRLGWEFGLGLGATMKNREGKEVLKTLEKGIKC